VWDLEYKEAEFVGKEESLGKNSKAETITEFLS